MRPAFYDRPVVEVAADLIGCVLEHDGCSGVIVETEAYHHSEAACHAYVGLTARTSTLFAPAGIAYVYRSYGVHALINAVCEPEDVGAAVLIRALEPLTGLDAMRARRGLQLERDLRAGLRRGLQLERDLCSGPGKLTQALGIGLEHNATDLHAGPVVIRPRPDQWAGVEIVSDRRIGVTRAIELPWRFCVGGSRYLSRPVSSFGGTAVRGGAVG